MVTTRITRAEPGADLKHWPEIRELLNTYCGYDLGPEDVIRHYDVTGKDCPRYFVQHEDAWEAFRADVGKALEKSREES